MDNILLLGGMIESNSQKVTIPNIKPDLFERKISPDFAGILVLDFVLELHHLADKYMVEDLKRKCENAIIEFIRVDNFVKMAKISESFASSLLRKAIIEFGAKNAKKIIMEEDYPSLPQAMFVELFSKLASYV